MPPYTSPVGPCTVAEHAVRGTGDLTVNSLAVVSWRSAARKLRNPGGFCQISQLIDIFARRDIRAKVGHVNCKKCDVILGAIACVTHDFLDESGDIPAKCMEVLAAHVRSSERGLLCSKRCVTSACSRE